jgi:hypothetical protein
MSDTEEDQPREPPEHPLVGSLRKDPARPATPTVAVTGLFGRSDDPEKRRVYFSRELAYYAEFRVEDVVLYESVPVEESPIPDYEATRVTLHRGSRIDFTYARTDSLVAEDQFDLDIRLGLQDLTSTGGGTCDTCATSTTCQTCTGQCRPRTMGTQHSTCMSCHLCIDRTMGTRNATCLC